VPAIEQAKDASFEGGGLSPAIPIPDFSLALPPYEGSPKVISERLGLVVIGIFRQRHELSKKPPEGVTLV
jgi:hypothetical protein